MGGNSFEKNNIQIWGDKGRAWLEALSSTIAVLSKQWDLHDLKPMRNLSYNYVMTGLQGTIPIALKIGCDQYEMHKEMEILKAYDGNKCIRLLDSNFQYHALLLELATPGTSLVSFFPDRDDEAIDCAVTIMQSLHAAPIEINIFIPTVYNWLKDLFEPPVTSNTYHIYKAQEIAKRLLSTQTAPNVLLHGDLHHGNILLSQRGWLAIDPKGVIGEPAFEVCAFIRNPYPEQLKSKELIAHRVEIFAHRMALDKQRLREWLYVRAVLDACWSIREGAVDLETVFEQAELVDIL